MSCLPWPVDMSCCPGWTGLAPSDQDRLTAIGVQTMWALTGRQFAVCATTVRPCPQPCASTAVRAPWLHPAIGGGAGWYPALVSGAMVNIDCMCGRGGCQCRPLCKARLSPGPVRDILAVDIAGVALPDGYQVVDGMWLVRTDGLCWPGCNAADRAAGAPDVWTVTYTYGLQPPDGVVHGAAVLSCELAKACAADASCRLPKRIQSVVREGVSVTVLDPMDFLDDGLTGVPEVDVQIKAFNPGGLFEACEVSSPDVRRPSRVTWSPAGTP